MDRFRADNIIEVNGVRLHYAAVGTGRPILLVHGNGESHSLFDSEIEQLMEAVWRVYAPDSRGHGANEPLPEYHYEDMAEDMFQLICALGLEKPAYYGHSDGGIIGLLLAIRHPAILDKMAVSGVNLSPEGIDPTFLKEYTVINQHNPDPLITLMLTEPNIDPHLLEEIRIPVLVTAGEYDLILPEETHRIAGHLPFSQLVIVPGADHGSYIVNSEVMGNLLLAFLTGEDIPYIAQKGSEDP